MRVNELSNVYKKVSELKENIITDVFGGSDYEVYDKLPIENLSLDTKGSPAYSGTLTTGNAVVAAPCIQGPFTSITNVTDITDPAGTGGWTELVNISAGTNPMLIAARWARSDGDTYRGQGHTYVTRLSFENNTKYLRTQIEIDDSIVYDVTVRGDTSESLAWGYIPPEACTIDWYTSGTQKRNNYFASSFYCGKNFIVRAAKQGSPTQGRIGFFTVGGATEKRAVLCRYDLSPVGSV